MSVDMEIDLPFVQAYTDRHGRRRYYFRRKGWPRARLPGIPGSEEFMTAYQEAMNRPARVAPSKVAARGSFAALCNEYERSAEFSGLAKLTQREMRYVIRKLEAAYGEKPVALLERRHVLQWRDALKDKPGAANKMIRIVKVLMAFAIDRGYRDDSPALGIKLMKAGSWRAWSHEEMRAFEEKWPLGSLERTGYALALYTGQRRADLVKLAFKSIAGNAFRLTQEKTGTVLEIPIHPELKPVLAAVHPRHEAGILTTVYGEALNPIYFGHRMAEAIAEAALPDDCVLHGLRKSAASALIDAGCTPHQAAAITGHQTMRMLEEYAKHRDQVKLGKAAMLKWKRSGPNHSVKRERLR
jgi:integrase